MEYLSRPYAGYLTFGIDIAAGIIIAISATTALIAFFKTLRKSPKEIDRHNVDLLESGKQPIAGRKTTTIFSYIKKNRQERRRRGRRRRGR